MNLGAAFNPEYCRAIRASGFWRDLTILDFLDRAVQQRGDHAAIIGRNSMTGQRTSISYRELEAHSGRIAAVSIPPRPQ